MTFIISSDPQKNLETIEWLAARLYWWPGEPGEFTQQKNTKRKTKKQSSVENVCWLAEWPMVFQSKNSKELTEN